MIDVSVIIPNYNHAPFLVERIESVITQAYRNFELIILDDCSTDASREIIEGYRNNSFVSKIIYNDKNSGSTFKQWQKGIAASNGALIWIAESDDIAAPDFLSNIVPLFHLYNEIGLAYSQSHRLNSAGEVAGSWVDHTQDLDENLWLNDFIMKGSDFSRKFMLNKNPIPNASAVVFKKSVYQQVGGVSTCYRINGDWDLYIRMLSVSNLAYVSDCLNFFREHSTNGSKQNIRKGLNVKEYYDMGHSWKKTFVLKSDEVNSIRETGFQYWCNYFANGFNINSAFSSLEIYRAAKKIDPGIANKLFQFFVKSR